MRNDVGGKHNVCEMYAFVLNYIYTWGYRILSLFNANITGLKKFPMTRYQGSKGKMLSWLYENLKELEFNSVLKYIFIQYL